MDTMKFQWRKWTIWLLPSFAVFLWETIRHEMNWAFLSTTEGNVLSMLVVIILSVTLQRDLINRYERFKAQVERKETEKRMLVERERWAEAWHDGIAQSLFLAGIQVDTLSKSCQCTDEALKNKIEALRHTIYHANADVRTAISQLRDGAAFNTTWTMAWEAWVRTIAENANWEVTWDWQLDDSTLDQVQQMSLHASLREAIINIKKHSNATKVAVHAQHKDDGYYVQIIDNGSEELRAIDRGIGLKIVQNRIDDLNGKFELFRKDGQTVFLVCFCTDRK